MTKELNIYVFLGIACCIFNIFAFPNFSLALIPILLILIVGYAGWILCSKFSSKTNIAYAGVLGIIGIAFIYHGIIFSHVTTFCAENNLIYVCTGFW